MPCTDWTTWNPTLQISVLSGVLEADELRARTLRLTYVDRITEYDHIEWELDNSDGELTRIENMCNGLLIRIKLGYIDGTFPWRSFIINRMHGGVGVYGREGAAVAESDSKIMLHGRNRNAPGGRPGKPWSTTAKAPRKPRVTKKGKVKYPKTYQPTSDVTKNDSALDTTTKYPRMIKAKSMSEAITEIARRNGFIAPYVAIQETNDHVENGYVIINAGISDAQFMELQAREYNFAFKIDGDMLRWHRQGWKSDRIVIAEKLNYGGPDIINITIDSDFSLPVPNKTTGKGYDLTNRVGHTISTSYNDAEGRFFGGTLYKAIEQNATIRGLLTREDTFALVGGTKLGGADKTVSRFIDQHMRAFQISVKCVGNPRLLANRLVKIAGTGSPFVDGTWLISEARHSFATGEVYTTDIHLKAPPSNKGLITRQIAFTGNVDYDDKTTQRYQHGSLYVQRQAPASLRR